MNRLSRGCLRLCAACWMRVGVSRCRETAVRSWRPSKKGLIGDYTPSKHGEWHRRWAFFTFSDPAHYFALLQVMGSGKAGGARGGARLVALPLARSHAAAQPPAAEVVLLSGCCVHSRPVFLPTYL